MDVLFNSIDVRDLLSSHELDDSSLLSAPDLRLLIDRLQVRSLDIKAKVQHYILSHHHQLSSLFAQCSDAASTSEQLFSQVSELLNLVSDHPIDSKIRYVVGEIGGKLKEVKEKKELLELVEMILKLNEELKSVKEELRKGRLIKAAQAVMQLKVALRICNETSAGTSEVEEEREPVVYGLLRREWTKCFEEMQEVLVRFMEHAVQFELDANAIHVKYQLRINETDDIELYTILEAMDVAGILDYGLAKVADLMIKYIITPAIKSHISFEEKVNCESGHVSEVVLKSVSSSDPTTTELDGEAIYSAVTGVINFIYKVLCFENGPWIHSFGRLTWPRISELIISNFLSKVVPDDTSKLPGFQKIIKLTSHFEADLKEINFISAAEGKDERLTNFAKNVEVHFATRKKVEILAKARSLLLKSDFSLVHVQTRNASELNTEIMTEKALDHVVDLLFSSEKCIVSGAVLQLMELVHQTLKGVCMSSTRVALELYHAARDALLLYEAVISVKLERQLDSVSQVAVLIHNDCLYLSQEILGLSFEYRSNFPSFVKEIAVYIDLAPKFHLMAEEILQRQIQLAIYNLKETIDGADGFQNTHMMKQYESAKLSIDQAVFILEKVHIIWKPLLLPLKYKRSMCMVLEAIFSRITKDILLLDDIAAEETLQLQRLIHLALENLASLLESLVSVKETGKLQGGGTHSLEDVIPSLCKIRKLADLLDMPLRSITETWETGELVSSGFTSSEVKDFIRAIFADSPLRKECLRRIENAGFYHS